MNRLNFVEDHNSDKTEPTAEGCHQFDYDAVEAAFSGKPLTPQDSERLNKALGFILDWLLDVDLNHHKALHGIGKRVIAMAWVLEPHRFGEHASLRSLCRQLGFTAPNLAPLTSDFSRLTKITNEFQSHDWKNRTHELSNN